jgi:hypothetical protein
MSTIRNQICELVDDEIRPYLNKQAFLADDKDAKEILDILTPLLDTMRTIWAGEEENTN